MRVILLLQISNLLLGIAVLALCVANIFQTKRIRKIESTLRQFGIEW